jgi:hypothetical protein
MPPQHCTAVLGHWTVQSLLYTKEAGAHTQFDNGSLPTDTQLETADAATTQAHNMPGDCVESVPASKRPCRMLPFHKTESLLFHAVSKQADSCPHRIQHKMRSPAPHRIQHKKAIPLHTPTS